MLAAEAYYFKGDYKMAADAYEAFRLAQEQSFDIVLGQGVVFASEKVDVTNAVIEKLKQGD